MYLCACYATKHAKSLHICTRAHTAHSCAPHDRICVAFVSFLLQAHKVEPFLLALHEHSIPDINNMEQEAPTISINPQGSLSQVSRSLVWLDLISLARRLKGPQIFLTCYEANLLAYGILDLMSFNSERPQ